MWSTRSVWQPRANYKRGKSLQAASLYRRTSPSAGREVEPMTGSPRYSLSDVLGYAKISKIYLALGGKLPGRRGVTFWRGGDGFNVSFDDERGFWRNFKTGDHGGILALVMKARDCSKREPLQWVADLHGLRLEKPSTEEQTAWRWQQHKVIPLQLHAGGRVSDIRSGSEADHCEPSWSGELPAGGGGVQPDRPHQPEGCFLVTSRP